MGLSSDCSLLAEVSPNSEVRYRFGIEIDDDLITLILRTYEDGVGVWKIDRCLMNCHGNVEYFLTGRICSDDIKENRLHYNEIGLSDQCKVGIDCVVPS